MSVPTLVLAAWIVPAVEMRNCGRREAIAQALRSRGEAYRRYQQTTSAFVPWFPWLGVLMNSLYRDQLAAIARLKDGGFAPVWSAVAPVYLLFAWGVAVFVVPRGDKDTPIGPLPSNVRPQPRAMHRGQERCRYVRTGPIS